MLTRSAQCFLSSLVLLMVRAMEGAPPPAPPDPAAALFSANSVWRIRIEVGAEEMAALRRESRGYVPAMIREGSNVYAQVGIHLKGSIGSFRQVDQKPAITLNFSKYGPTQRFHGLRKIHLNNSVEDPSYLNELLGSELFRAAGVPAARVTHALVEWNARPLGLYVLKEGFTEDFLALHFSGTTGNLYEGSGHEITDRLPRDLGEGTDDQADLHELALAAQEPDLVKRWQRLGRNLDMERFLSFMALEVMIGHRDGYCLARNNYRVYHDPDSGQLVFLPHGMDQIFGNATLPWQPHSAGLVAQSILETLEGRAHYRERFALLFTNLFQIEALTNRLHQWVAQIRPQLGQSAARELEKQANRVKERIEQRKLWLQQQLSAPALELLAMPNGIAQLSGWQPMDVPVGGTLDQSPSPDAKLALHIVAGPRTSASWRTKVLLSAGHYRFQGMIRTADVVPLPYGRNRGAGLRVSDFPQRQPHALMGSSGWEKVEVEFAVRPASQEVELTCELRAGRGEAWFDTMSLQLVRLPR